MCLFSFVLCFSARKPMLPLLTGDVRVSVPPCTGPGCLHTCSHFSQFTTARVGTRKLRIPGVYRMRLRVRALARCNDFPSSLCPLVPLHAGANGAFVLDFFRVGHVLRVPSAQDLRMLCSLPHDEECRSCLASGARSKTNAEGKQRGREKTRPLGWHGSRGSRVKRGAREPIPQFVSRFRFETQNPKP